MMERMSWRNKCNIFERSKTSCCVGSQLLHCGLPLLCRAFRPMAGSQLQPVLEGQIQSDVPGTCQPPCVICCFKNGSIHVYNLMYSRRLFELRSERAGSAASSGRQLYWCLARPLLQPGRRMSCCLSNACHLSALPAGFCGLPALRSLLVNAVERMTTILACR